MIAGFEEPTEGRVLIDGEDVAGLPAHKRPTNTVFQSYALFPHLSVARTSPSASGARASTRARPSGASPPSSSASGLAREANRRPNQLSGGQQQRVALARALVNLPKVLLLDEPLGALDLKLRKGLQLELKRIQREVGITFVYVTHDQEEALTMSDRIAVMNHGRIEQVAPPEEVYERPTTTFVAGFIGVSNLMPGTVGVGVQRARQRVRLDTGRRGRGRRSTASSRGDRCHAVVRPEKLRIDANGAGPPGGLARRSTASSRARSSSAPRRRSSSGSSGDVRMTVLVPNADEAERARLPAAAPP